MACRNAPIPDCRVAAREPGPTNDWMILIMTRISRTLAWLVALSLAGVAMATTEGDVEAGRMLYEFGRLANGEPVRALGFGETEITGETAACIRCHRRSGFGSYEGGFYIPPITRPYMFEGRQISRDDRFRALFMQAQTAEFRHQVRRLRDRDPYTRETLARVLNEGIDPNGRELEWLMPRYDLGAVDLANLLAYLETLSAEISEGVGETWVHLATIVHRDVPEARREAMIGTLRSFVEWYNERTRGDLRLAGHSVYGSSLYTRYARLYQLDVWELEGPPESWPAQLEAHYRDRPVFALVSGQVEGPWREIGRWADEMGLPTIFPLTDMPHQPGPLGGYTVYFNEGMRLEADLAGEWLHRSGAQRVVQVIGGAGVEKLAAARLQQRNAESPDGFELIDLAAGASPAPAGQADSLIVWLRDPDPADLRAWQEATGAQRIVLPSAALDAPGGGADWGGLAERLHFTHPYALKSEYYPERFRARAWMNTRGLDYAATDVQFHAYYAMLMFRDSFIHLLDHYHRDYLLEVLEHQIQGSPNPGLYPDMQLAPQQRFASRSGYIVRLDPNAEGGVSAIGERIIP